MARTKKEETKKEFNEAPKLKTLDQWRKEKEGK